MGAFSYHRFIFLLACIDILKVYNRLKFACTVKTAIEVKCLCVSTSKKPHSCRAFLFACAANLALKFSKFSIKKKIIEDTHLTLAVIPFKVEAKNSLILLISQTYEKKIVEFSFLLVYNSLI